MQLILLIYIRSVNGGALEFSCGNLVAIAIDFFTDCDGVCAAAVEVHLNTPCYTRETATIIICLQHIQAFKALNWNAAQCRHTLRFWGSHRVAAAPRPSLPSTLLPSL